MQNQLCYLNVSFGSTILIRECGTYTFQDLWQAFVLFELAWMDFHELVLMNDLWSIGNHDFVVEKDAHRFIICCVEEDSPFLLDRTTFCLGGHGVEFHSLTPFVLEEQGLKKRHVQRHLFSLWCENAFVTGFSQNVNGSFRAGESQFVRAASTSVRFRLSTMPGSVQVFEEWKFDVQCLLL
ncbi:hypothetical protein Tco_0892767 [Tanacetum coccineum]|uniref:Uncharacterized protein n=1 Tax=Tanacetum coccineum TaxID=301880 RepID=A0ABQ5C6V3_9ASTR